MAGLNPHNGADAGHNTSRRGTQHEQCVKTSTQIHTHDMHRHPHARMHTPHTARTRAHVMRHAVLDLLKYAEVTAATRMR